MALPYGNTYLSVLPLIICITWSIWEKFYFYSIWTLVIIVLCLSCIILCCTVQNIFVCLDYTRSHVIGQLAGQSFMWKTHFINCLTRLLFVTSFLYLFSSVSLFNWLLCVFFCLGTEYIIERYYYGDFVTEWAMCAGWFVERLWSIWAFDVEAKE